MNHEIQLQMGDLERAPGGPANVIGHSSAAVTPGATSDLEDPPGLYEKVGGQFDLVVVAIGFDVHVCAFSMISSLYNK